MKVSSIKYNNEIAIISLDDGSKYNIDVDLLNDIHLYKSRKISDKELEFIKEAARYSKPFSAAKLICNKATYSVSSLKQKLEKKKFSGEEINYVIDKLEKLNILNEEMSVKTYYKDVADIKLWGYGLVVYKLKEKGYPEELINGLDKDEDKERKRAIKYTKLLSAKLSKEPNPRKKGKIIDRLIKRGFDYELSVEIGSNCIEFSSKEEVYEALKKEAKYGIEKYSKTLEGKDLRYKVGAYLLRRGYLFADIDKVLKEEIPL